MNLSDLLAVVVSVGSVQALLTVWLKARLESSIKHEYDQKLEEYRYEMRQREQAAMVAELLAEWVARPTDTRRLTQLVWGASLWLPAPVARELARTLSYATGAQTTEEILIEVRKVLKGASDDLTAADVIHFSAPQQGVVGDAP
jgi:hypothetical protein